LSALLLISVCGALAFTIYWTRSAFYTGLLIFGSFAVAGGLLGTATTVIDFAGAPSGDLVSPTVVRFVASITFVGVASVISLKTRRKTRTSNSDILVFALTITAVGILTFAHLSARGSRTPLAGLGMLLSGEDNAKWLNFTSHLTLSMPVSLHGGNAGGEAILLTVAVAIVGALSHVFMGGINEVGISVTSVVLAHEILVSLSALAVGSVVLKNLPTQGSRVTKLLALALPLAFSSAVLSAGILLSFDNGQLTAEFVMAALTFGLGSLLRPDLRVQDFVLTIVVVSGIGFVWLPLIAFGPILGIIGLVLGIRLFRAETKETKLALTIVLSINVAFTALNTLPDFHYLLSQAADGLPLKSLVTSEGGTPGSEWYLVLVTCLSLAVLSFLSEKRDDIDESKALGASPLWVLALLACAAWYFDAWSTHAPGHYGTLKLTWVACVVITSVSAGRSIDIISKFSRKPNSLTAVASISLVLLFTFTGMFPRGFAEFSPDHWSKVVSGAGEPGWASFMEPDQNTSNHIAQAPVGCIMSSTVGYSANFETYRCTRFLVSLRGLEKQATPLIDLQLYGLSSPLNHDAKALQDLSLMTDSVRSLNLLKINEAGRVVGLVSIQQFERSLPKG
jgi:hypothetical protein